jgi:hypothetical protein
MTDFSFLFLGSTNVSVDSGISGNTTIFRNCIGNIQLLSPVFMLNLVPLFVTRVCTCIIIIIIRRRRRRRRRRSKKQGNAP